MVDKKVTVVARIKAKPGMEQMVKHALMALVPPTRAEWGCINYDLHQALEDPCLFLFYENWESKADLDEHLAMPYLKGFVEKMEDALVAPIEVSLWNMLSRPV